MRIKRCAGMVLALGLGLLGCYPDDDPWCYYFWSDECLENPLADPFPEDDCFEDPPLPGGFGEVTCYPDPSRECPEGQILLSDGYCVDPEEYGY